MELVGLYIYAYVIGSIPTPFLIGRIARGIDIREYGSGNVGSHNVFHNVGKFWVLPLCVFEFLVKGASPVWIGSWLLSFDNSSYLLSATVLISITGNNWSPWLKFSGGRGLAVVVGGLGALAYREMLLFVGIATLGWIVFKSSGIWSLISLLLIPLWAFLFGEPEAVIWMSVGIIIIVIAKRITSNWDPLTPGISKTEIFFNRCLRDRDVSDRDQWLKRSPIDKV